MDKNVEDELFRFFDWLGDDAWLAERNEFRAAPLKLDSSRNEKF